MMTTRLEHPTVDELEAYARGKLGTPRTQEVEDHLGHCSACLSQLDGDDPDTFLSALRAAHALPLDGADGSLDESRRLGDYVLLEEVGRGGMGVVYRARQVSVGRAVAVKTMLAGQFASGDEVRRFRSEAEAAAALDHPHIVPIYEVGEHDGRPFFSMKLIEGRSLAQSLRQTPMAPRTVAGLVAAVARAVHHAHQRGVIHRDLKPGNILLDATGQPHVADFGLARRSNGEGSLSQSGIVGTLDYMAPEQAAGHSARLTPAADVWSLGAILFETLTGQPPFRAGSIGETLRLIQESEPSLRTLRPSVDRDLETVCLKCLQKEPRKRYESAQALAEDLERWLNDKPILARRVGPLVRLVKWSRRHPAVALLSVGLVTLTVLLIVVLTFRLDQAEAGRRAAEIEAEALRKLGEQQRREKQMIAAHSALRSGTAELERGEIAPGLLWLVRGLEEVPAEEIEMQRSFRLLLAGWSRELHPLRNVIPMTPTAFPQMAVSPDCRTVARGGSYAVTCGQEQRKLDTVELWDFVEGRRRGEPLTLPGQIDRLDFSPDGRVLAVGGPSMKTHYLDVATGKPAGDGAAAFPPPPEDRPTPEGVERFLALTPDQRTGLAVVKKAGEAKSVRLWNMAADKPLGEVVEVGFAAGVGWLSPDARRFVVAGKTVFIPGGPDRPGAEIGQIALWEAARQRVETRCLPHPGHIFAMRFSSDGRSLLTSCDDDRLRLWGAAPARTGIPGEDESVALLGRLLGEPFHQPNLDGASLSPDGRLLFANSNPGGLFLDAATGQPHGARVHGGRDGADWVEFTADSRRLLTHGGFDLMVYDVRPTARGWQVPRSAYFLRAMWHPDGRRVLSWLSSEVRVWEANGRPTGERWKLPESYSIAQFSPDGRTLLAEGTIDRQRTLRLLDATTREPRGEPIVWEPVQRGFSSPLFSPDGGTVLLVEGQVARLWDARTGRRLELSLDHGGTICTAAFAPDGRMLATGGLDGLARLWSVRTGQPIGEPLKHGGPVQTLAFSPDGGSLQTGENVPNELKFLARLWPVSEHGVGPRPTGEPITYADGERGLRFSPDGRRLLGQLNRDNARQWDVATGQPLGQPIPHGRQIDWLSYSPDGSVIATAGLWPQEGGQVHIAELDRSRARLWDAGTGKPLGPTLVFATSGNAYAKFNRDGTRLLVTNSREAEVIDVPRPVEGEVERLRLWVETSTGLALDAGGALHHLDAAAWQEKRNRLERLGGVPLLQAGK